MNNGKKKKNSESLRITVTAVDVLIMIAALLLCLLAVRYVFSTDADDEAYEVSYVIKLSEVRDEFADKIAAGDVLYLSSNGVEIGTVKACEVTVAVRDKTGQHVPGRSDIYVTVEALSSDPETVSISGCDIFVEGEYSVRTADFSFECVCISIGN